MEFFINLTGFVAIFAFIAIVGFVIAIFVTLIMGLIHKDYKPLKTTAKFFIIPVVVLVISLFSYGVLLSMNWKYYENERFSYSINYPKSWTILNQELNKSGVSFNSGNNDIDCRIYGFENVLTNDDGAPQSLDEFVDWMTDPNAELSAVDEILLREKIEVSKNKAIHTITFDGFAIYDETVTLINSEYGIRFSCLYPDIETMNNNKVTFTKMYNSIIVDESFDANGNQSCASLLSGSIMPLKDLYTQEDTNYNEVTMISRQSWDKSRLPSQVVMHQDEGYNCYPLPVEFSYGETGSEPMVTKVEWNCELEYKDCKFFNNDVAKEFNNDMMSLIIDKGYKCDKQDCFTENDKQSYIWQCCL